MTSLSKLTRPAIGLLSGGVLIAAMTLGANNSPLSAIIAVAGVTASLSFQNLLSHIVAGRFIRAEGHITASAVIEIPGVTTGQVQRFGLRASPVLQPDGRTALVPNGVLLAAPVILGNPPDPPVEQKQQDS